MNNSSAAKQLLGKAERQQASDWLAANLLTAAAVASVLGTDTIVVGGTAEAFWTGRDVYHPTDLDLWTPVGLHHVAPTLTALGFKRAGRHWERDGLNVVMEFPGGAFAGAVERLHFQEVEGTEVPVIGLDDLYVDRLTQATADPNEESVEFMSALSVATHRYDDIDWAYVSAAIRHEANSNEVLGRLLRRLNRRIRQLVRRRLSQPDSR